MKKKTVPASRPKSKKSAEVTRSFLEKSLEEDVYRKKGTKEREVALILLTSAIVGPNVSGVRRVLGDPKKILNGVAERALKNGIWKKGKVMADWPSKKSGVIALLLDVAVCLGYLDRADMKKKK